ncbi:MAG: energy-coupling factor transporter ATPase [Thermacetogeniaceae bacterium]
MIRVENLVYRYDENETPVLRGVTLEIRDGEYVALIGPNGCGKTTLVKHFNALLLPTDGDVWVDGKNTRDPSAVTEIRQRVGMIFQNPDHQIVGMTVEEDVSFGPGNLGLPPSEIRQRVDEALEAVGLTGYAKRYPYTLSGGEKQLLAIAGILAMRPKHIALDEPTSSLDPAARRRITALLRKLNKQGITVIHITHHVEEIVEADRVIVMDRGRILLDGKPEEVFSQTATLKALGMDVPQVTELMWRLSQLGMPIRTDILTVDAACAEIARLLGESGNMALSRN